ncbi:hypothetical protein [Peptoniphilus sp. oral taxon 386]|uniref:hypothetical protein n=1 Tax=Peptoniphilus sp. oral taxon 386 TaxID=652713 RepID=UPI0001DA9ED2|nr:hypothetical protein [Peptoniphilus sp. oral taxon 386]EFI41512.1 hypothetical protein HMPREF0629_00134 [Peptoniphilus sp. oral taxon 386 str. F0131]
MKKIKTVMTLTLLLSLISTSVYAKEKVTLPTFKVKLNGIEMKNDYSKYPLIVYKDVTYFPMTYHTTRFLGLETKYTNSEGLRIEKINSNSKAEFYESTIKNDKSQSADKPIFKVRLNGKEIKNNEEKYPLLVFRDVTYFPMTWRFCVDEFGWEYSFDKNNGLVINSKNISEKDVSKDLIGNISGDLTINESKDKAKIKLGKSDVIAVKNNVAYYTLNGVLYSAPVDRLDEKKEILKLDANSINITIRDVNGRLILYYQSGYSPIMSSSKQFELKESKAEELKYNPSFSASVYGRDYCVDIDRFMGSNIENLYEIGTYSNKLVGEKGYSYGYITVNNLQSSAINYSSENLIGYNGNLYAISNHLNKTRLSKIDVVKNTTKVLNTTDTFGIFRDKNLIYYTDLKNVYTYNMDNGDNVTILQDINANKSSNMIENKMAVLNSNIYYRGYDSYLYLNKNKIADTNNLSNLRTMGNNNRYIVATFSDTGSSSNKIMVFDELGRIVFKTADASQNISIDGNKLYYHTIDNNKLNSVELNK